MLGRRRTRNKNLSNRLCHERKQSGSGAKAGTIVYNGGLTTLNLPNLLFQMGLFSFLAKAGKNIFGGKDKPAPAPSTAASSTNAATAVMQEAQAAVIKQHVQQSGVNIQGLDVRFDGDGKLVMQGQAASKADYEKAALIAGNVIGVSQVDSQVQYPDSGEADAQTYEVQSGDTLSKIAKQHYGDANAYMKIFEANKPMLKDPDEIYPGQVLRIPAA